MKTFSQQPTPAPPQVELPQEFPEIPQEIIDRFGDSARDWQRRLNEFWTRSNQAIQQAQDQTARQINSSVVYNVDSFLIYANGVPTPMFALDSTGIRLGNVLVVNTPGRKVYIGAGEYANDNTPFYIDTLGFFSLGASLTWDPETDTLTITGIINATSGTIGGFEIGADYIRDTANSFGLSSTVTGSADVRFWAGDTFANRNNAPATIKENGDARMYRLFSQNIVMEGSVSGSNPSGINFDSLSVHASAGFAYGIEMGNFTLISSANGDWLRAINVDIDITKDDTGLLATGLFVRLDFASGTGTIDNAYGVYIDTVNIGTANWGLYVATTARNYMAGDLTVASIGSTTPGSGAFTTLSASKAGASEIEAISTDGNYASARATSGVDVLQLTIRDSDDFASLFLNGNERLRVTLAGVVQIPGLAGVGTRTVVADASGNLSAP